MSPEERQKLFDRLDSIPASEVGDLLPWHEDRIQRLLAEGTAESKEENPLDAVLADLSLAMRNVDPRIEALFFPGLLREELEQAWKEDAHPLPDDIVTLYAWHNGIDEDAEELFRGHRFLPFADVLQVWKMHRDLYSGDFLPFMQNIFGFSVMADMRRDHHAGLVYETDADDFCHPLVYPNLAAYFAAVAACFREGVFQVEAGGGGELVGRHDAMQRVCKRFSLALPEEKKCRGCADLTGALKGEGDRSPDLDYRVILP